MNRFRAVYVAAIAVVLLGAFGTVFVPKASADTRSARGASQTIADPSATVPSATDYNAVVCLLGTGCLSLAGLVALVAPRG